MMFIFLSLILTIPCVTSKYVNICRTKECVDAAAFISENIDKRIKPCDDFYQFTCGRFGASKKNKGSVGQSNVFKQVQDNVINQLEYILNSTSKSDIRPVQLAKDFYYSCVNDNTSHHVGIKRVYQKISSFIEWSAIMSKNQSWIETIRKFRNAGFKSFYLLTVDANKDRIHRFNLPLQVMPPELNLNAEILKNGLSNGEVKKYYEFLLDICQQFNKFSSSRLKEDTVEKRFLESFKLEVKLADIVSSIDRTKFQVMDIETAQYRYPFIHWIRLVQASVGSAFQVTARERIIVLPRMMERMNELLKNMPNEIINDYLIWRNVFYGLKLIKHIYGWPREKECVTITAERFESVLTPVYLRKHFQPKDRENILDIVQRVKSELHKSISSSEWLDALSRKNALDKLHSTEAIIGFTDDQLKSDQFFTDIYQNLQLNSGNYFESTLSLQKFESDLKFLSLRNSTVDVMLNSMSPFDVNGNYDSERNTIIIRAAALQNLFYSVRRPNYLNYGFAGFMVGHEFSHAFDDENYKYDKNGRLRNWSSAKTRKIYYEKRMCFIRYYNNFTLDGKRKVDGFRTLDENMSDYEGIKAAYNAYISWLEKNSIERMLPRLFFTNKQMFWISAATMWCSRFSPCELNHFVENSLHSFPRIRVNALVSNIKEFSRDFRCPKKSKMNSLNKCSLW